MEQSLDQISPILPIDFFQINSELLFIEGSSLKKKHVLPEFSELLFENNFATVSLGWNLKGINLAVGVIEPFKDCFFPDFRKGDSIEVFIDTRDLKSAGFLTRFCHHFVFLPKILEGIQAQEVTSFRTDDRHELCDPKSLQVQGAFKKKSYTLEIFIPSECLHGYDPSAFDRIGFTYRMNRVGGDPQHFAVSSDYLAIENQPSLWSSMQLRRS